MELGCLLRELALGVSLRRSLVELRELALGV